MKDRIQDASDRALRILGSGHNAGTPAKVENFEGSNRPGYGLFPFEYAVNISNDTGGAKKIAFLSNGLFSSASALTTAGLPVDALWAEGTVIDGTDAADLIITSENPKLNADMMAEMSKLFRLFITDIRITSDVEAQFAKTFERAVVTPISEEGKSPLRIKPYFNTNQQSTQTIDMVLSTRGDEFWISNINLANLTIVDGSSVDLIISGMVELPL